MAGRCITFLVQVDLIAAHVLGGVAGDIGIAHDARDARTLAVDHYDTDRTPRVHRSFLPIEPIRLDGQSYCLRNLHSAIAVASLEQNTELIAAEPRNDIGRANVALNDAGHFAEQLIAGGVAKRVVDHLELIQVDVQHRVLRFGIVYAALQGRNQLIFEFAAIDQTGRRIVRRLVGELPEQARLLADVMEHHDAADHIADAVANRRCRILNRNLGAVPTDQQ